MFDDLGYYYDYVYHKYNPFYRNNIYSKVAAAMMIIKQSVIPEFCNNGRHNKSETQSCSKFDAIL